MDYLPIFFKVDNKRCLIVGGGEVALRKAKLVQQAGGHVHVVAPHCCEDMASMIRQYDKVSYRNGNYKYSDLDQIHLVIAATNNSGVNQQVSADAHKAQVPVNVVDQPELCSFILPAVVDRSPVVMAVSSGGKSPVLARLIRGKLETMIPAQYGRLAELVGGYRQRVKSVFGDINTRRDFWQSVLEGPIAERVFSGQMGQAKVLLEQSIDNAANRSASTSRGEVYLVGGGPGDPDLLTFRALRLMQQSDVVLYDRLVAPEIVDLCRRDARRINVGKARDKHTLPQNEINQLLLDLAQQGHRVCRLKGGDPFIFGRGGEEIDLLTQHKIPFQVVPGITAASGCACYAGIPLTHRDYSQSVHFVTGHLKPGGEELNWRELVRERQTLVFYMGLMGLEQICKQLIVHKMNPDTPVALVEKGTTTSQKVYTGTLQSMPNLVQNHEIHAPTLIIVGEVVKLRDQLAWFDPTA